MKITKNAKSVKFKWNEYNYTRYESEYQCPCCCTIYRNTLSKDMKISRFYCDCGQELIIKE